MIYRAFLWPRRTHIFMELLLNLRTYFKSLPEHHGPVSCHERSTLLALALAPNIWGGVLKYSRSSC